MIQADDSAAVCYTAATRMFSREGAMAERQSVSVATLKAIAAAFNAHDLDAIMEFFADDCSLDIGSAAIWACRSGY